MKKFIAALMRSTGEINWRREYVFPFWVDLTEWVDFGTTRISTGTLHRLFLVRYWALYARSWLATSKRLPVARVVRR